MVKSCAVVDCRTNERHQSGKVLTITNREVVFKFPDREKKPELFKAWVRFINRPNFNVTKNSGICLNHFNEKFIKVGQRKTLRWELDPEPSVYDVPMLPSVAPTPVSKRKKPKDRSSPDEIKQFTENDIIRSFADITTDMCPQGFTFEQHTTAAIFYKLEHSKKHNIPQISATITIDTNLHVKLYKKQSPIPLPEWFRKKGCKCTRLSILENFPAYIINYKEESEGKDSIPSDILEELNNIKYKLPDSNPKYSANLIRYALLWYFSSPQSYRVLLQQLPFPSEIMLRKLASGGVDAMKACELLLKEGHIDKDVIILLDEMYIQKEVQFVGGKYIGADDNGKLYKGVMVFMIVGLKNSIPFVVKAIPETTVKGSWLKEEIDSIISDLNSITFSVRAVVADNHTTNVSAYRLLHLAYGSLSNKYVILHPSNTAKIYLFYDAVHLLKNIRNNLLAYRLFRFPEFNFNDFVDNIHVPAGTLSWKIFHDIHEKDQALINTNLRKAPRISYKTLHPGDNKQNVQYALNVFHETTSAAITSYFPTNKSAPAFLNLIYIWWTIMNSKQRFNSNCRLGNAAIAGDKKPQFLRHMANWINEWQEINPGQCLSSQTASALTTTLRCTADLIEDLLDEDYSFVLTARFQTDPLERRFSQYRQMSGGRFLVGLRELQSSERVLKMRSLIKEDIDFWKEDVMPTDVFDSDVKLFENDISLKSDDIQSCMLTPDGIEVAAVIAGYIVRKYKCEVCKVMSSATGDEKTLDEYAYLVELSRGGLIVPKLDLCHHVAKSFAMLDLCQNEIETSNLSARHASLVLLRGNDQPVTFLCQQHEQYVSKINKTVTNVFWNNQTKDKKSQCRKDGVEAFKKRQLKKS